MPPKKSKGRTGWCPRYRKKDREHQLLPLASPLPNEIWSKIVIALFDDRFHEPVIPSILRLRQTSAWLKSLIDSDSRIQDMLTEMKDRIREIIMQDWDLERESWCLSSIPHEQRTPDMCLFAVKLCPSHFQSVPKPVRSLELCRIAVTTDGQQLKHVPIILRTPEICSLALKRDPWALHFVPECNLTMDMCLDVVSRDGRVLKEIPEHRRAPEICQAAVRHFGSALRYVPQEKHTSELYWLAIKQHGSSLKFVPEKQRTLELCVAAVESHWSAVRYVPDSLYADEVIARLPGLRPLIKPCRY